MNAVTYAITQVMRTIPHVLLKQTFIGNKNYRTTIPITVNSRIQEEIIYKTVLVDMNIVGGTTALIPLSQCIVKSQDMYSTVYYIPKELTENRDIVNILEMTVAGYHVPAAGTFTNFVSEMGIAQQQALHAAKSLPYVSEGRCMLINENTIMVELPYHIAMNNVVRCTLSYDHGLRDLDARSYLDFAELVVLATKAYIYVNNVVEVDMGKIMGGVELGVYKDLVNDYADAHEQYMELLRTRWAKVDKLNDYESKKRLITLLTGRVM